VKASSLSIPITSSIRPVSHQTLLFSQDKTCSKLTQQASGAQQEPCSCYLWAKPSNAWKGFSKLASVEDLGVTLGLAGQHAPPWCSLVVARSALPSPKQQQTGKGQGDGPSLRDVQCCVPGLTPTTTTDQRTSMDRSRILCSPGTKLSSVKPFRNATSALLAQLSDDKKGTPSPSWCIFLI